MPTIEWTLPIKTVSESNLTGEHWSKKSSRHKKQKESIAWKWLAESPLVRPPCTIELTRIAPRQLDSHDNLRTSFKWIVDAISEQIFKGLRPGHSDSNPELTWEYKQEKGRVREYAIRIKITYLPHLFSQL